MKHLLNYTDRVQTLRRTTPNRQQGSTMIIGVICLTLLVLIALGMSFYFLTHKEKPTLTYTPPAVTADDRLTAGTSNNELIQDARIINEGVKRDDTERIAADTALSDQAQPITDPTSDSTTVETGRLSALQTAFISESDRRLKVLNDTLVILPKLTVAQQTTVKPYITDEITAITGLKAKAASETTPETFAVDKTALDKEYGNYLLAIVDVNLLLWADDQAIIEDKANTLGGKYQERINSAGNQGKDTALAQTLVNSLQANKATARDLTAGVLKAMPTIKPGDYNANRSVLRTYYTSLNAAHSELNKYLQSASSLISEMVKL